MIITELAVIKVTRYGLLLTEIVPTVKIEDVIKKTDAALKISADLKMMKF